MFESNYDIDVDDEFLNGVFDNDPTDFKIALSSTRNNSQNASISINDAVQEHNNVKVQKYLNSHDCFKNTSVKQNSNLISQHIDLITDAGERELHSNKENKRKHASPSIPLRTKRERKFPGPAGLLPDRKLSRGTPLKLDSILEADKSPPNSSPDDLCSQGRCSGSVLEDEPWQTLLADLGPDRSILDLVNVANVKRKAAARCFVGKKVPFLAAVLHHLDVSSPDPCIILRDSTGEIHGTLHREVWDQFAGDLIVGSVLVVRNVGLFSTGLSSRRHYLNITANNLVTIYSANSDKSGKSKLHSFLKPNYNEIIVNWRALVSPSHGLGSPTAAGSPTLFNSSFSSPVSNSSVENLRNLNSDRYLSKRTVTNQNSTSIPQFARPNPAQNLQFTPSRTSGTFLSNYSRTIDKSMNIPARSNNDNRLSSNVKSANSVNMTPGVSPSINQNLQKSINHSVTKAEQFNFSPVIVKPKSARKEIFSCYNSEIKANHNKHIATLNNAHCDNSAYPRTNNAKLVLSQTSELTQEEQSMVESVFDGIDADSLFDDDF